MAYLDNSEIIVDAILTKKGREKLSTGEGVLLFQSESVAVALGKPTKT